MVPWYIAGGLLCTGSSEGGLVAISAATAPSATTTHAAYATTREAID